MKIIRLPIIVTLLILWSVTQAQDSTTLKANGLFRPVIVNKDQWGVSHIKAANEHDLFFAQGYQAAKDRLFQFEIFRRQATGTVAEILGSRELSRDIGARLFMFKGDIKNEMKQYHPRGDLIITSFVEGINAYIRQVLTGDEKLPMEFQWLGIKPGYWTPEVVISRHNGLLGNIQEELNMARAVSKIGEERVLAISNFQPHIPSLKLDSALTRDALKEDILKVYNAYRKPIQFEQSDLIGGIINPDVNKLNASLGYQSNQSYEGSNNWVIQGSKSASGYPILANDPHRAITVPSLRYITHLQAPGWNVIGGGEPILPGISIGHNEYGAWGLTIFETDIEDLIVYKLNPQNSNQYQHQGKWIDFKSMQDTILIKNQNPQSITHHYTIHGPVTFIDTVRHLAYAVRCAWLSPGCAPYLSSLRMDQAKSWEEFKLACKYAFVPAENMIWADRKNNIGWQTVGIAPIRPHHSGMVPMMDTPTNQWTGYLPILQRPSKNNPKEKYIATANENLTPSNYPYMNSIGYGWADPYRGNRIREVLKEKNKITIPDIESLQTDYTSIPARYLFPKIARMILNDPELDKIKKALIGWNQVLNAESGMAGLYVMIERKLEANLLALLIPENQDEAKDNDVPITNLSMEWMLNYLDKHEDSEALLVSSFTQAVIEMQSKFGNDINAWSYGQPEKYKHIYIQHALSKWMNEEDKQKINTSNVSRGGNGNTVCSTGDNDNQSSGASFRIIVDCADWDQAMAINTPGQSGNPDLAHYKDLFELWSKNQYFPLYYSMKKINEVTEKVYVMKP